MYKQAVFFVIIEVMGKSIILEGIDGTGKSSIAELLKEHLEKSGQTVLLLREPGGSAYYEAIRQHVHFADLERSALSDALTCAGGIAENVRHTRRALEQGQWVITDRSYISNKVYQVAQGLDTTVADRINDIALSGFSYDHTFVIDVPLQIAEQRLLSIGKKRDRWETMGKDYFKVVKDLYLSIAEQNNLQIIDGTAPLEAVVKKILAEVGA